ncbi:MAG: hypothetical protein COA50_16795 [Flavobacteriaceae bacterium]|nr:MAG: hypothetical protein COA50_16795 [Flavobacteriaceae bacterium]
MKNLTKLLIISDTHHCSRTPKSAYSNALEFARESKADYVLLLGDFADRSDSHFKRQFFDEVKNVLNKPFVLGCPGNHDVDHSKISERTKTILMNMKTNKRLNKYQERLFFDPIGKSAHLSETLGLINGTCVNEFQNAFWSIYDDPVHNIQFIIINSAYFCGFPSDGDSEVVGVPEQVLASLDDLIIADRTKIVLMHHPIEKFYRTRELPLKTAFEDFCARHADFVIFGDEHYQLSGSNETIQKKYFVLKSMPFSARDSAYRGMTVFELPVDKPADFRLTHLENKVTSFPVLSTLGENGFHFPSSEARNHWQYLDNDPSTRIACFDDSQLKELKLELTKIICPDTARTKKAESEFNIAQLSPSGQPTIFNSADVAEAILSGSTTAILAPKDTGLTTLGHQIAQHLADGVPTHGLLPCFVDCSAIAGADRNRLLRKIYQGRSALELSESNIKTLLERNQIVVIFDGITDESRPLIDWIGDCLPKDIRRLFLITENTSTSFKIDQDRVQNINVDNSYVMWPLTMVQIQRFIKEFYPGQDTTFLESRREKVVEAFKILNEPRYPAFVESVLHVLNRDPDFKFTSKYEAIGKSIDARLGRRQDVFVTSASKVDYETKRLMLGFVCSEILKLHIFEFSEDQWKTWIEEFSQERDLLLSANDLLNEFLDVGILIQRRGCTITFRSDYIFYYFISIWMYEDDVFYSFVLSWENIFRYHEAILYFIADKSKHKVDILSVVQEHLSKLSTLIDEQYEASGLVLADGMSTMQLALVASSNMSQTAGYIADAEKLNDKQLLENDKVNAAEQAVAGTGTRFGITKKPDIHANEARFLALLRTYSKSLRFIGNRTSLYKQEHLRSLFSHAWTLANIVAHKSQHLLGNNFYLDEGIAYINFSTDLGSKNEETRLFFKILNSVPDNLTNYAASSQLVQSLDQIEGGTNEFMQHWKRCFLLETCDEDLFPKFLDGWKKDENVYTRLHAAKQVVRLAERFAYDERKFQTFKRLNSDIVRSVRARVPGISVSKEHDTSMTESEKKEYFKLTSRLANLSVQTDDEE